MEDLNVATSHVQFFKSGVMDRGNYTMTLVTDGVSSNGPTFYLDFLRVLIPDGNYIASIPVDDNDDEWDYTGNWVPGNHTGDYLYSAHETPHEGGSAELKFYGSDISVYGSLNGKYNEGVPIAYINVAAGRVHTVLAQDVTSQPLESGVPLRNQLIWSTSGLRDLGMDQRTLTISIPPIIATPTATGSVASSSGSATPAPTISNPSWFLDYAIYGPYSANASPQPTSPPTSNTSTSPPAGAIAGGVIGALALVSLIVVAFLLWRRRKQRRAVAVTFVEKYSVDGTGTPTNVASSSRSMPMTETSRRLSIHKAGLGQSHRGSNLPINSASQGDRNTAGIVSPISPGFTGTGVGTGQGTSENESDHPTGRAVHEIDAGVRLASSSDYDPEPVTILPPRYQPYTD